MSYTKALLCMVVPCVFVGADATLYWGFDHGSNNDAVRLSHPNSDAAYNSFTANFSQIGTESLETVPAGPLAPPFNLFHFQTTTILGWAGSTSPPPEIDEILGSGTNTGSYPIDGNRYLCFGLDPNGGGSIATTMSIQFNSPVAGFGLYLTDVENAAPRMTVNYTDNSSQLIILPGPTSSAPSGSVWFWGWQTPNLGIKSVILQELGPDRVGIDKLTIGLDPVPEPGTLIALTLGGIGLLARRRRRTT